MRLLVLVLVLGVIALALALIVLGILIHQAETRQAWQAAEAEAQWVSGHHNNGQAVHVVVRRLATLHGQVRTVGPVVRITTIDITDPEWSEKFREAKQVAYDRAIDLNMRI